MRFAYDIVVDKRGLIEIDGVPFPYYVHPDVEVCGVGDDEVLAVTMTVYADSVTVVDGKTTDRYFSPSPLQRAGERARNIVRDGLSDALPWLRHAREV